MRILLAHNSLYAGSFGGGDKSNRLLMEALAARGHSVRVVARLDKFDEGADPVSRIVLNQVEVHTLLREPRMAAYLAGQIAEFDPDVILTSTDDPAQLLFETALNATTARVVHLVRATIAVPFGPDSSMKSVARTEKLRRADLVVGVSEYVARYVREWGHMDAVHVPISLMEPREWPDTGRFDNRYVTLVNPCAVKGIDIFLELAARMPELEFAAVPTWGTNAVDLERMARRSNITVLPPVSDIDRLLAATRVMLVPSLWAEARSRMVVEAMLGGIPVVASDIGGIPEAKLGVPYLIPVRPIVSYKPAVDENMVPVAEVPAQDLDPWQAALQKLTTDPEHWSCIARASRQAALDYAGGLSAERFEQLLNSVAGRPARRHQMNEDPRQKLLALRLKQRSWFPNASVVAQEQVRVFCFPHAGAGALAYRGWDLGNQFLACPAVLPGRESRSAEPAIEDMTALVHELTAAIHPFLDRPFAFFGHSMGAGIAFELARALRRCGLTMPRALYVSAARAPQYRLNWTPPPEPTDEELRLMGPDLALSILRADTRLYRNYHYSPASPLDLPLYAYGGAADTSVGTSHLDAWREQTTRQFIRREFPGGHLYVSANGREQFLEQFRLDLQAGVMEDS